MIRQIEDFYRNSDKDDWSFAMSRAQEQWNAGDPVYIPNERDDVGNLPYRGFTILFQPRVYYFSKSILLVRGMSLIGSGAAGFNAGTIFAFDSGTVGITCERPKNISPTDFQRGEWSIVERVRLEAIERKDQGTPNRQAHGVLMYGVMKVRDCYINKFEGDGIYMAGGDSRHNSNTWQVSNVVITACQNGIYTEPGNSSAGCAIGVSSMGNRGWGINENSTHGNTYIACHVNGNLEGGYRTRDDSNGISLFLNCYSEGDQQKSEIHSPSIVVGGILDFEPSLYPPPAYLSSENSKTTFPWGVQAYSKEVVGEPTVMAMLGSQIERVALELHTSKPPQTDLYPYRLRYETSGWWELHADIPGDTSRSPIKFSTNSAATSREKVNVWFENGYFIGSGGSRKKIEMMVSPPTAGDWEIGDQIWNSKPDVSSYIGWVYVADPSDPTNPAKYSWHGFGKID